MKIFYTDRYVLPLPPGHRFPMGKYEQLRQRVLAAQLNGSDELREPHSATDEEILLAHDREYLQRVVEGSLTNAELRRIGFPWSPQMVERSRRSSGATLSAARAATRDGVGVNLAGGTHHAFRGHGEGCCVFNDAAITALNLQREGLARRVVVIDCDVHQGNGTASILQADPTVFTFSIHGANNFPFRKEVSDLDIELPDGTRDEAYLRELECGLAHALSASQADFAIYLAGADPFEDDRLGRLKLSKAGLQARDHFVLSTLKSCGIPVAIAMAGGYARTIEDSVEIHFNTVATAHSLFSRV